MRPTSNLLFVAKTVKKARLTDGRGRECLGRDTVLLSSTPQCESHDWRAGVQAWTVGGGRPRAQNVALALSRYAYLEGGWVTACAVDRSPVIIVGDLEALTEHANRDAEADRERRRLREQF